MASSRAAGIENAHICVSSPFGCRSHPSTAVSARCQEPRRPSVKPPVPGSRKERDYRKWHRMSAPAGLHKRRAHAAGSPDLTPRGARKHKPGDRRSAVHQPEHGGVPPAQGVSQARRQVAHAAREPPPRSVVGRPKAAMDVVVDHADVLHECVHTRRPDEAVPLRLQLLRERLRLRGRLG